MLNQEQFQGLNRSSIMNTASGLWLPNMATGLPLPDCETQPGETALLSRRHFMTGALALGAAASLPRQAFAAKPATPTWPSPTDIRQVWLARRSTGESVVARYYDGMGINVTDYVACCRILRDVQADKTVQIDVRLLDLLFSIQKWLVAWGIDRPLTIYSGYRSEHTNRNIEGAARNSKHLRGQAADIRIEGIPASYLAKLAAVFGQGGVGFYISSGFVHVDVGRPARFWQTR